MTAADHDVGGSQRRLGHSLPAAAKAFQGRRAGVVSRGLASLVDLCVVALLVASFYFATAGLILLWDPKHAHLPPFPRALAVTLAGVVAIVYLAVLWSANGRTYGAQLLGLRVESSRGDRLHLIRVFVRAVVCVVFPIGLLLAALNRSRRSLADFVVASIVVYDWTSRALQDED